MSENADILIFVIAMFGFGWMGADNWHSMKAQEAREYALTAARVNSGADVFCNYTASQMRSVCDRPQWMQANNESWYARGK